MGKILRKYRRGIIALHVPPNDMCKEARKQTERFLNTYCFDMGKMHWIHRAIDTGSCTDISPTEAKDLARYVRIFCSGVDVDTLLVAGSQTTMFVRQLIWDAARNDIAIWNYAFPGSDLDEYLEKIYEVQ